MEPWESLASLRTSESLALLRKLHSDRSVKHFRIPEEEWLSLKTGPDALLMLALGTAVGLCEWEHSGKHSIDGVAENTLQDTTEQLLDYPNIFPFL